MKISFQLLDEPWIPVEQVDGETLEVSLLNVFDDAHHIRRITHYSPLVTVSLYRLLFAIYHRAVSINSPSEWGEVWDEGGHLHKVQVYLEQWRHRFDLFDEEAPFWQVPDMTEEHGVMPWAKLAVELNDNNNPVLFDHTIASQPKNATFAEVARVLVATQMISVGAGKSKTGYNSHSLIANTLVVIPEGENLRDTLIVNAQFSSGKEDRAIWEQAPFLVEQITQLNADKYEHPVTGIAERLTWMTRAIRVRVNDDDQTVARIHFGAGIRPLGNGDTRDPWVAYRLASTGDWVQQRLQLGRAIWRDLNALISSGETSKSKYEGAQVVQRLRILSAEAEERHVPKTWTVLVGGQAADKAKIEGWALERWNVPDRLVQTPHLLFVQRQAMQEAEEVRQELWKIAFNITGESVAPERKIDRSEQVKLTNNLPTEESFWVSLEPRFSVFLRLLGESSENADLVAINYWREGLIEAVREAKRVTYQAIGRSASEIRAWARADPRFYRLQLNIQKRIEGEEME